MKYNPSKEAVAAGMRSQIFKTFTRLIYLRSCLKLLIISPIVILGVFLKIINSTWIIIYSIGSTSKIDKHSRSRTISFSWLQIFLTNNTQLIIKTTLKNSYKTVILLSVKKIFNGTRWS